ncbi:ATP-binding cassette domain-containing protein, partial [Escherichia coli]|nr:ATP-binding cassette domain-containing protein [Escherichia coli]
GSPFASHPRGLRYVGALLDARDVHGGRTGYDHLAALARSNRIGRSRVLRVLAEVGLADVAKRRVQNYSLGMKQRLGLAAAMLGDPRVLILDEPANGLDPEGIRWMRGFLKGLAAEGRTVLVSSHLLSEMQLLADDVVIIAAGQLVRQGPVDQVIGSMAQGVRVRVRTPQADVL